MPKLTRRDFIRSSVMGAGAAGVTGLGFDVAHAVEVKQTLRIAGAKEVHSLCPYCAVGLRLVAYTRQDAKGHTQLLQIEGDPDSPVNEGRLCPKGATAMQLAVSTRRVAKPLYRAPGSDQWEEISWDDDARPARPADQGRRATRRSSRRTRNGNVVNRCEGIAFAGGAAFCSEEGYFATKLMRTLGVVHIEQQARV